MKDFNTLDELRSSLLTYIKSYNQTIHQSLNNISPVDRFFEESTLIKRLSDEQIDQNFLLELERRVSADNVVIIDNIDYEVNYRYAKQRLILRYAPDMKTVYIVDKITGELEPIKLLNKHENSQIKREKVSLTGGK